MRRNRLILQHDSPALSRAGVAGATEFADRVGVEYRPAGCAQLQPSPPELGDECMTRKERSWTATPAIGVLLWTAVSILPGAIDRAGAAAIGWETRGAFQQCLEDKATAWLGAKVELVVNDDPDMGAITDVAVAEWATQAIKECGDKTAGADAASELQFMKYMAHWRDHIYTAATEIRRRTRPD
jgi:hypothetical protein